MTANNQNMTFIVLISALFLLNQWHLDQTIEYFVIFECIKCLNL